MESKNVSLVDYIDEQHGWMDDLLLCHQEALIERDMDTARFFYTAFHKALSLHAQAEDELLLPVHEQQANPKWPSSLYGYEHRKINQLLEKLALMLGEMENPTRREVIELLDEQKTLKGVMEHHGEREVQGLLPELESALAPDVLQKLMVGLADYWDTNNQEIQTEALKWRAKLYRQ